MSSSLFAALSAMQAAIIELVEGQIGLVRTVPQGAFKWADLVDAPIDEQQRVARQTGLGRNWFDLDVTDIRDSATGFSAHNTRRNVEVDFELYVIRYVQHRSTIEAGVRIDSCIALHADLDDVVQALCRPHNLDTDSTGSATGIVDGCVRAPLPALRRIQRDWTNHLLTIPVPATVIVDVVQEV